jgi:2-polyprenyl-3-methyl-5-hydroxy-6-metoxy-1,4-benzoquinol methylase
MKGYNIRNDNDEKMIKLLYNEDYKRCYQAWEPRLAKPHYRFLWALERTKGKTLLDFGCGDGVFLAMCSMSKIKPSGYDISSEALSIAKAKLQNKAVLYDNLDDIQNNYYDNVTCFEVLEHVDQPPELMIELFKKCKEGGRILITVPIEKNLNDPMHKQFFDYYSLFSLVTRYTYDFNIFLMNKFCKTGQRINVFGVVAVKHKDYTYDPNKTIEENLRKYPVSDIFNVLVKKS